MLKNSLKSKSSLIFMVMLFIVLFGIPVYAVGSGTVVDLQAYPWSNDGVNSGVALDPGGAGIKWNGVPVVTSIGDRTYAFSLYDTVGIYVCDVTDPANPYYLTTTSSPKCFASAADKSAYMMKKAGYNSMRLLYVRKESDGHTYLYATARQWDDQTAAEGNQIRKIDVTDPTKPQVVTYFDCDGTNYVRDIYVLDDRIYAAGAKSAGHGQLRIYDAYATGGTNTYGGGVAPLYSTSHSTTSGDEAISTIDVRKVGVYTYVYGIGFLCQSTNIDSPTYFYALQISDSGGHNPATFTVTTYKKDINTYIKRTNIDAATNKTRLSENNFMGVAVANGYAYVVVYDQNKSGLNDLNQTNPVILNIDVSDPTSADFANATKGVVVINPNTPNNDGLTSYRNNQLISPTDRLTWVQAKGIQAVGNMLYILDSGRRVLIYDVTDTPTAPKLAKALINTNNNSPIITVTSSVGMFKYKDYLYINFDGTGGYTPSGGSKVYPQMQVFKESSLGITSPIEGAIIKKVPPLTFSGISSGGNRISLTIGNNPPVTITPSQDGTWSYTGANDMQEGSTTVRAELTKSDGTKLNTVRNFSFFIPKAIINAPVFSVPSVQLGDITASISVNNEAGNPIGDQPVELLLALYYDGELVDLETVSKTVINGASNVPLSAKISIPALAEGMDIHKYTVCAYVWQDEITYKPLKTMVSLTAAP